jgi:hypothetical protein
MEREPLSERLPPWALAIAAFLAVVIAGAILIAVGISLIGVLVLVSSPLIGFVVWIGADRI